MKENGFDYVDLGLPSGTMWATCNVGADKPEDEGLLFQFGRVDGYRFGDTNHNFRTNKQNKQDTGDEFIPKTTSGKLYGKNDILDLEDDAAHVNMGGKWRMPTNDQLKELINNTTHNAVTINGVKGMLLTSNINGQLMFIPFGGWWDDDNFDYAGYYGIMWSSQVQASNVDNNAYILSCYSGGVAGVGYASVNYLDFRSYGFSVRGVFKK